MSTPAAKPASSTATPATSTTSDLQDAMRQYGRQARAYADQARDYADLTRERVREHPLQSAAIAFAVGLLYDRLFHKTRVHVVRMPVPVIPPEVGASIQAGGRNAGRLLRELGDSGLHAARQLGHLGATGLSSARAASADALDHARTTLPHQARWASAQLRDKSQAYGHLAREQIEQHPLAGVGVALGAGALLVAALASGRTDTVTPRGLAVRRPRAAVEGPYRAEGTIGAHPVAAAAVALLAGALLGTLVRR